MPNRNLLSSPIKGVVIIIMTMTITYMTVSFIRLNDIPNSNLQQIGIENQKLLQQNNRKLDRLYEAFLQKEANEKVSRSSLQSKTQ